MASKLRPGGLIISLLPDKRRTFDADRPISTLGKVFEDYLLEAKSPSIQSIIDCSFYHRTLPIDVADRVHFSSAVDINEGEDIRRCLNWADVAERNLADQLLYSRLE